MLGIKVLIVVLILCCVESLVFWMKNAVHLVIFMRNMPCRWNWKIACAVLLTVETVFWFYIKERNTGMWVQYSPCKKLTVFLEMAVTSYLKALHIWSSAFVCWVAVSYCTWMGFWYYQVLVLDVLNLFCFHVQFGGITSWKVLLLQLKEIIVVCVEPPVYTCW